jgi:hypothetical protein
LVNTIPAEFFYTSIYNDGYFQGIYALCQHTISLTNLHLFQFADEMSNSHIYKFSQNNLYSYNIIADSMEKDSYFRKQRKKTVQRLKYQGVK